MASHKIKIQPDGNSQKVHLIMLAGGDNRGKLLEVTIPRMRSYFNTAILTDTGSSDNTKTVCSANQVDVIDQSLNKPLPLCHEPALDTIPTGEWIYYADSDECPSQMLLDVMRELVFTGNKHGIDSFELPCAGHWFKPDGKLVGDSVAHILQGDIKKTLSPQNAFKSNRLTKKTREMTIDYDGSHYAINPNTGMAMYYPAYWNHYKGYKSRAKSMFLHAMSYPDQHDFVNCDQRLQWDKIRLKNDYTMIHLSQWAKDKSCPPDVMEMIGGWKDSEDITPKMIYEYIFEYDWDGDEPICEHPCCFYSHNG